MLLGEFDYADLEAGFKEDDGISKFFTISLIVGLMICGLSNTYSILLKISSPSHLID